MALAQIGTATRGVIFATCGALAVRAAWSDDPERVGDIGDALAALGAQPAGPWVVGIVGLGCAAYGVYQLAKARWRRVRLRTLP